jgi:hypothetical protein
MYKKNVFRFVYYELFIFVQLQITRIFLLTNSFIEDSIIY